jgi:hypothetical protein
MKTNTYYINKLSDTSADTLLAVGFASQLSKVLEVLQRERKGILLQDVGFSHEISLPTSISDSDLQHLPPFPLMQPLVTSKLSDKQTKQGKSLDGFPYEQQQQLSKTYREKLKQLPPYLQRPEAHWSQDPQLEAIAYLKPRPELGHYQTINQMKIAASFNELALRWNRLTPELLRLHIKLLLTLFSSPVNDITSAIADW